MTNQEFCYWLQGYFEIAKQATLTKSQICSIADMLRKVDSPLEDFTKWLFDVIDLCALEKYRQKLLDYFLPLIMNQLNSVFFHVIDHSYDTTTISLEKSKDIHDGL